MRIILLFSLLLGTLSAWDEFIITYRGVVKENRLYSEQFNVAQAMVKSRGKRRVFLTTIPYRKELSIPALLRENQDLISEELFKQGILTNDALNSQKYTMETKTVITLPPTRITVTIKEDSANIHLIK